MLNVVGTPEIKGGWAWLLEVKDIYEVCNNSFGDS